MVCECVREMEGEREGGRQGFEHDGYRARFLSPFGLLRNTLCKKRKKKISPEYYAHALLITFM